MPASDYVYTYLHLWCSLKDGVGNFAVRNYLQNDKTSKQSQRAMAAYQELLRKLPGIPGYAADKMHPDLFTVGGEPIAKNSIERVFIGKGAPNEIQDVVWLASLAGMVKIGTIHQWADTHLGVDCGGFVANYWGMGRPSDSNPKPNGYNGFSPRSIWNTNAAMRRKEASQIQADDAAIFFQDVKGDNPDTMAKKNADGAWDKSSGSQAHHIAVVDSITPAGGNKYIIRIAETSGSPAMSGGNGVNWRYLGNNPTWSTVAGYTVPAQPVELGTAHGLVFYKSASGERVYFVGRTNGDPPYPQENQSVSAIE